MMKIVGEKTQISLNIRVDSVTDFLKHFWLSLIFLSGVTIALINPTSMKLLCHRVQTEIVCEVTTWNMFNLHSDKTDLKLQGVRYQDGRKSGPWVVLETSSGDIYSPDGIQSLYRDLRQVQDFLQDKRQSFLHLDMEQHWLANIVRGMLLLLYLSITYQLLRFPIIVKWIFILDVEQASADRSRSSGTLLID